MLHSLTQLAPPLPAAQVQAVAEGQNPPTSVRDVPFFPTDVSTGAGGAIRINSAAVQWRVAGLFAAALAACQLNQAGGLKLIDRCKAAACTLVI